jgi:hypothetical protein
MEQNYFEKKHSENGPRPIVIKRIFAYSKYFNSTNTIQKHPDDKA